MLELIIISVLLGLSLGSFANVCIYRLPRSVSVITPRSFCPNCKQQLSWFELIPMISFLWSQGKCRNCGEKISPIYPIIEILAAAVTLFIVVHYGISLHSIELIFYFLFMLIVAMIDWKFLIIPNQIVIAGLIGGFILKGLVGKSLFIDSLIGLLSAFTILFSIRMLGNYVFKKQTMGWGDVKLAAVVGLFLGFQDFLLSLWLAAIIGSVFGIFILHNKTKVSENAVVPNVMQLGSVEKIPFGALLAGVSCVVLFLQTMIDPLIDAWLISIL